MSSQQVRPLRADAQQNYERLLAVAARAFTREGAGASLKTIAQEAGVGIGTLYRRFPTRETLVEAVYRNEVARLCTAAPALVAESPPVDALRTWMEQFIDFMAAKHGMADALRAVLVSEDERMHTRGLLRDALATLLDAGVADGVIRPGLDPYDLLMGLGGITLIAEGPGQRDLALRLVDLLINGVRL
ncbi:TetR/AcrR family transcriptional regulator [Planotetraspora sp. A-T 1434]|uniref:TetR/AcrR family transcriptional regulator n=1 Tax=Planotetraspora sp. A-T 1434 TaxID=2979219 RepID=UPI0021BEBA23|nr:TetR/AcrR family transcriptional regulator [Planotetraspora sp. A-T 1434]MCT9929865.1 TetR/AcrR family transcriptional regulator [Planotetraspora sp. A-T 1434]